MLKKFKAWYEGKYILHENPPGAAVFFVGGRYERHWTAQVLRVAVEFYLREWKWVIGTAIAVTGLALAVWKLIGGGS